MRAGDRRRLRLSGSKLDLEVAVLDRRHEHRLAVGGRRPGRAARVQQSGPVDTFVDDLVGVARDAHRVFVFLSLDRLRDPIVPAAGRAGAVGDDERHAVDRHRLRFRQSERRRIDVPSSGGQVPVREVRDAFVHPRRVEVARVDRVVGSQDFVDDPLRDRVGSRRHVRVADNGNQ